MDGLATGVGDLRGRKCCKWRGFFLPLQSQISGSVGESVVELGVLTASNTECKLNMYILVVTDQHREYQNWCLQRAGQYLRRVERRQE